MDGFLLLVQALPAFALTILALMTAVAALVGTVQRLLRWRARVLREMVEFFYRNEVQELIENLRDAPSSQVAGDAAVTVDLSDELKRFVEDPGSEVYRRRFIAHMTLLPTVLLGPKGKPDREAREKVIEKTDPEPGADWVKRIKRWPAAWQSLKHGLDRLSDEDFAKRLRSSLPGQAIAKLSGDTDRAETTFSDLKEGFDANGSASLDLFQRRSRQWSVAFGFVLAFGVNIDALFLINSYLTSEELRLKIIDKSETIVTEAKEDSKAYAQTRATVSAEIVALTDQFEKAAKAARDLSDEVGEEVAKLPIEALKQRMDQVMAGLESFQQSIDVAADAVGEAERASGEIRGVVRSLTQSFPVGWTLYPNCALDTPDLRCPANNHSPDVGFWGGLADIAGSDTSGFIKWVIGVLLTGLMVGLGTPFWVQAVNGALAARKWFRGGQPPASAAAERR